MSYARFAAMIITSTIVMFGLMYEENRVPAGAPDLPPVSAE